MPTTKTIASDTVTELWAALVSAQIDEGERLGAALAGAGKTVARFGQLRRAADKDTVRLGS